jgi:hypothetical protein
METFPPKRQRRPFGRAAALCGNQLPQVVENTAVVSLTFAEVSVPL